MPSGISPGGRPIDESPLSSSKDDNWVAKVGGLPPYIRGVARGIAKKHGGAVTSKDIAEAIGRMKVWAAGGGGVTPAVQAASAAAIADWEAKKAKAHSLSAIGEDDLLLSWATFDANRGTKGNQAAAQQTGAIPGYTGPPLDPGTIAKIKAFQAENGLPVSGNLDSQTVTFAHNNMAKVAGGSGGKSSSSAASSAAKKAAAAKTKADKAAARTLALEERSAKIITAHKVAAEKKAAKAKVAAAKKVAATKKKAAAAKAAAAKKAAATAAKTVATTKASLQAGVTSLGQQAAALDKAGNHRGAEAMRVTIAQLNAKIASTK